MHFNGPWTSDVLVAGRKAAVYPGGDLIVAGRINIAGINHKNVDYVADSIAAVLS